MSQLSAKQLFVILTHAFIGWSFCPAIMGIGMHIFSMQTILILHVILGPLEFAVIAFNYFQKYWYTSPLATALFFA